MKSNTRLLRRPQGGQRLLTLCVPSTPADTQLWKQRHILHWPCCRSVCATAGVTLQPHPHMNTEKRSDTRFIFKLKKKTTILYSSSSKHEVTFLKAMLNSVVNTWEESSRTFIWTWSSFSQGPEALQSCPLWPHKKTSSLYFATYSSLKSLKQKLKLTKCLEK